jgi:hypothetical protein
MSATFGIHSLTETLHYNANRIGKMLRTALFWVTTQRVVVICYLRFGTTYRSHLMGSRKQKIGPDSLSRNVGKKLPLLPCVITQKRAVLIYFAKKP